MLTIATDVVPRTSLSFVAFRVAFQDTLERIGLARQVGDDAYGGFGYLTEVPFLRAVPPLVQLDLLAGTWSRHIADESFAADLVDESVIYAACETAANVADQDREGLERFLSGGPVVVDPADLDGISADLRAMHLSLASEGDFLLISQFEDIDPEESRRLKRRFRINEQRLESMFEVLGRWHASPEFGQRLGGLLRSEEILRATRVLGLATPRIPQGRGQREGRGPKVQDHRLPDEG
jgi:hypothetical protein